jgi:phosphopantetheine adenylyltransferase
MKITTEILQNPRWYETIMLKSGNLEGDKRINFIDKISEQNLYLAAKCKNVSFKPEPDLIKRLLQKAKKETADMNNAKNAAQGILTLAEFECEKEIVKLTINLAFEKLFAIYEAIDHFGLKPPIILSDLLVLKTPIDDEYEYRYELTYASEYETIKRIYNMTRYHIPNFQKIFSLVKQIISEDKAFKLNLNTYNSLINKAQTYQQRFDLFQEMKRAGLTPNEISYNSLINKVETYQQGVDWFEVMKKDGLTPNQSSYNTLINKAETYQQRFDWFEEMKKAGLTPNEISYNSLINKVETYQQGVDWFEVMKKVGLTPNEISYSTLINKAETYQQAVELFLEMKKDGLILNEISYNTLINKAQTYQQGFDLFQEMKKAGLKVDEISYNTLINKAQTYQQGIDLFQEMKKAGLTPDVFTFNTLLKKATQHQQPLQVFFSLLDDMINLKIKPQVGGINKKGKKILPYTVFAVQKTLRKNQKPYKAWVQKKREQLKEKPRWLQTAWTEFFRQTVVNGE